MNGKPTATEILSQFTCKKVWNRLCGPLANDWLSIREASMEVDETRDKRYTLNRSVQLCINELKNTKYLEMQEFTKVKESTTKVGTPRKYTSTCLRYKLNVPKLCLDFLAEKCPLNGRERVLMMEILREPEIERVLRSPSRELMLLKALAILICTSDFILRLETLKEGIEKDLERFCSFVERENICKPNSFSNTIELGEGDAREMMECFLEFLSQSKTEFTSMNSLGPKDRKRFLKTQMRKLFKEFTKQACDKITEFFVPRKFLDAFIRKVQENRSFSIRLLKKINSTSFEPYSFHTDLVWFFEKYLRPLYQRFMRT